MDEYKFLEAMYQRMSHAEMLDKRLKELDKKVVSRAFSCLLEQTIRDYLEMRKEATK